MEDTIMDQLIRMLKGEITKMCASVLAFLGFRKRQLKDGRLVREIEEHNRSQRRKIDKIITDLNGHNKWFLCLTEDKEVCDGDSKDH